METSSDEPLDTTSGGTPSDEPPSSSVPPEEPWLLRPAEMEAIELTRPTDEGGVNLADEAPKKHHE